MSQTPDRPHVSLPLTVGPAPVVAAKRVMLVLRTCKIDSGAAHSSNRALKGVLMAADWKSSYSEALSESDPARVNTACNHARRLVNDRALEIGAEMKELEEALRQLFIHQTRMCGIAPD